jgi:hypothetical protein
LQEPYSVTSQKTLLFIVNAVKTSNLRIVPVADKVYLLIVALLQFDWNLTRNENMADISGLQIAYKTWGLLQEEYDPDPRLPGINLNARQLFFLNAAQVKIYAN